MTDPIKTAIIGAAGAVVAAVIGAILPPLARKFPQLFPVWIDWFLRLGLSWSFRLLVLGLSITALMVALSSRQSSPVPDIRYLEINSHINLGFRNSAYDKPTDYDIVRDGPEGSKTLRPPELNGRKIVALWWVPIYGVGSLKGIDTLDVHQSEGNQITIEASTPKKPDGTAADATGVTIKITVVNEPVEN